MNSYRNTILKTLTDTISQSGIVAEGSVYRTRVIPLIMEDLPAIVIKPSAEKTDILNRSVYMRRFDVKIEVHARGAPSCEAADTLISQISNLIGTDPTIKGLVREAFETEILEPVYPTEDGSQIMWEMLFTFVYATNQQDCSQSV